MKISYFITVSTETTTFYNLTKRLGKYVDVKNDEVVIVYDTTSPLGPYAKTDTEGILLNIKAVADHSPDINIKVLCHPLNHNYSEHKNWGIQQCSGEWLMQIDADELPPETIIGENLHTIIESNPETELFLVPRINDFRGVTEEHAKQWGWKLTQSKLYNRPIVNFPDFQSRILKKDYPRIHWERRLHERVEGYTKYSCLPPEEEYSLYHDKTIETQIKTNLRYNQEFSVDDNMGHKGYTK